MALMKTKEILKVTNGWAKKNGHKIQAKILQSPPDWVKSEDQNSKAGVFVKISAFGPEYFQGEPCDIWLSEKGDKNYFQYQSGAVGVVDFGEIHDVEDTLSDAVDLHLRWEIHDIIEEWAKANQYELDENNSEVESDGVSCIAYEYGLKNDPAVKDCFYPAQIGYSGQGNLIVERKIAESQPVNTPNGPTRYRLTGSWFTTTAKTKKTTRSEIIDWLNENAKTDFYENVIITHLDKKNAARIVRAKKENGDAIFLYELKSATDDGVAELCRHKGSIELSEQSFVALTDEQLEKLIKNTNGKGNKRIIVYIGIFIQDGIIPKAVWEKMKNHPIGYQSNGHYYISRKISRNALSDQCARFLAASSSGAGAFCIEYEDSSLGLDLIYEGGALSHINRKIKESEKKQGAAHPETISLQDEKVCILIEQRNIVSAMKHSKNLLAVARKFHGATHEITISVMDRYACTLHELAVCQKKLPNKYSEKSEALYCELLKHYKKKGKDRLEDASRIAENLKNLKQS